MSNMTKSPELERVMSKASQLAGFYDHDTVQSLHLLLALYQDEAADVAKILRQQIDGDRLSRTLLEGWGFIPNSGIGSVDKLADSSVTVIDTAERLARRAGSPLLAPVHLAFALFADELVMSVLAAVGVNEAKLEEIMRGFQSLLGAAKDRRPGPAPSGDHITADGGGGPFGRGGEFDEPFEDPLMDMSGWGLPPEMMAMLMGGGRGHSLFGMPGVRVIRLIRPNEATMFRRDGNDGGTISGGAGKVPVNASGRQPVDPKSALAQFGIDLTEQAAQGKLDPVIGRDTEIHRAIVVLNRKTKNCPLFLGHEGVGKSAIVEGIAMRINKGAVPERLKNRRLWSIQMSSIVAGAAMRGEAEQRLKQIIAELEKEGDIGFIDETHTILSAGASLDASNMLKPALARGRLRMIGATTFDEYRHFRKDKALRRRFQSITTAPATPKESIEILLGLKAGLEQFHKVSVDLEVIEESVRMAERYITDRYLPDKAIDVLDEAGSEVSVANAGKEGVPAVTLVDVAKVVSKWTGIPLDKLGLSEKQKYLKLEEELKRWVVGQDHVLTMVASAIRRARAGLADKNRPLGSFMFLGRTGIGKTEVARALQRVLFDNEDLLRIDMSEYMERHSVSRLIGAPPGYVGYDEGGTLTEAVRQKPYRVILFDEVEKAHPDVFNILLQVLDDGRLTDGQGQTVDFTNTVIILSSNAGVEEMSKGDLGFGSNHGKGMGNVPPRVWRVIQTLFRPEFLNRLDEIVLFNLLSKEDIVGIVDIQLRLLEAQLAEQKVKLELTAEAKKLLAELGWDEEFGARPLKRVITRLLRDPLSDRLLAGVYTSGMHLEIGAKDGQLVLPEPANANQPDHAASAA